MSQATLDKELESMLIAYVEGVCEEGVARRTEALIEGDPTLLAAYVDMMHLHATLQWRFGSPSGTLSPFMATAHLAAAATDSEPWVDGLADIVGEAPATEAVGLAPQVASEVPGFHFVAKAVPGAAPTLIEGWPFAYLASSVICAIGILILALIPVHHHGSIAGQTDRTSSASASRPTPHASLSSSSPRIGQITGMFDCQWGRKGVKTRDGALAKDRKGTNQKSKIRNQKYLVAVGDQYTLASGLLEITYDTGAKVTLQGPCTYEVESKAGGFLSIGKLTARVEKRGEIREEKGERAAKHDSSLSTIHHPRSTASNPQSLIPDPSLSTTHHPLFTIRTPTATVTDLGTEFGVEVDRDGRTASHVFRGVVEMRVAGARAGADGASLVLHENESARVGISSKAKEGAASLTITSLAVAPTGFVREIPRPTLKTFDLLDVVAGGDGYSGRRNAGIDPTNGRLMQTQMDVNGDCDLASDGQYHRVEESPFIDGVFIPDGRTAPVQLDSAGHTFAEFAASENRTCGWIWVGGGEIPLTRGQRIAFGDIDYDAPGHGVLSMHANKGITFDLGAIRQANPGCRLVRFRALAGNAETFSQSGAADYADLWVFVDGQQRLKRRQWNGCSGVISVVIPVGENSRFLTLMATDSGNGVHGDLIVFTDPRLELAGQESVAPDPVPVGQTKQGRPSSVGSTVHER